MKSNNLYLDWCTFKAAKYAVEKWHYSRSMPVGKLIKIGVWENNKFIGCILFCRGANLNIGKPYKLKQSEICELGRVALNKHITSVTKIISISINMIKKNFNLKLIISYADMNQDHYGIIYQAGNWIYTGIAKSTPLYYYNGRWMHQRQLCGYMKISDFKGKSKKQLNKFRYLYPLNKEIRKQIEHLKKPYPKTCPVSNNGNANGFQSLEGGSIPTTGLKII